MVSGIDVRPEAKRVVMHLHSRGDVELELWAANRHASALAEVLELPIHVDAPASVTPGRRPTPARHAARRAPGGRRAVTLNLQG